MNLNKKEREKIGEGKGETISSKVGGKKVMKMCKTSKKRETRVSLGTKTHGRGSLVLQKRGGMNGLQTASAGADRIGREDKWMGNILLGKAGGGSTSSKKILGRGNKGEV